MGGLLTFIAFPQPYALAVARGQVPDSSGLNKFGVNPDVDVGSAPEDIWEQGGTYTFPSAAGAVSVGSGTGSGACFGNSLRFPSTLCQSTCVRRP